MRLQKDLVTFKDSWLWAAVMLFVTVCVALTLNYSLKHGFDGAKPWVLFGVAGTFAGLTGFRYAVRNKYIQEWNNAYQCSLGRAVIVRENYPGFSYVQTDRIVSEAAKYWLDWYNSIHEGSKWWKWGGLGVTLEDLEKSNEYKSIFIVKGPIEVYNPYYFMKLAGMTDVVGNVYAAGKSTDHLMDVIKHEISHTYLFCLGIPEQYHHEIFKETGYC